MKSLISYRAQKGCARLTDYMEKEEEEGGGVVSEHD